MKSKHIEVLVAEIGSTTTLINAFDGLDTNPSFIGQGVAMTTVKENDVSLGLSQAFENLKKYFEVDEITYDHFLGTSSAAGGLKVTVHGLVLDMTVKAAKEAANNAGANIKLISAGKLSKFDVSKIKKIEPNLIIIAGGLNYGERTTLIHNAEVIASQQLNIPVICAGNIECQEEVEFIFEENGQKEYLFVTNNVYPSVDTFDIEPTRLLIQDVFEKHITKAKGLEHIKRMLTEHIIPTPGAVFNANVLLAKHYGDVLTVDIGGATTDIHSYTTGTVENQNRLIAPEPIAKRTVEGDVGLYVSLESLIDQIEYSSTDPYTIEQLHEYRLKNKQIPETKEEYQLAKYLAYKAFKISLDRHVGDYKDLFTFEGKKTYTQGKDLTNIKVIVGTGGALVNLDGKDVASQVINSPTTKKMYPSNECKILIDKKYIMASCGVISLVNPQAALKLLEDSFNA